MLVGVKWGSLREETKADLLERASYEGIGKVIVDLTSQYSIAGTVIDNEEERVLEIDDEAIIYNPEQGIVLEGKELEDVKIFDVITLTEAAEMIGQTEGALRDAIKRKKFIKGVDYRKAGRITLISMGSIERVYWEKVKSNE